MKSPVEVLLSFLWVFLFCLYFRIIRKTGFEFDQEDQRAWTNESRCHEGRYLQGRVGKQRAVTVILFTAVTRMFSVFIFLVLFAQIRVEFSKTFMSVISTMSHIFMLG